MKRQAKPKPSKPTKPSDPPLVLYAVKGYGCDTYFGEATFDTMEDGAKVCVYDLREVRVMRVTRGLR